MQGQPFWVNCSRSQKEPEFHLFCFPHAGGGTAVFRKWADILPRSIHLWVAQLPGRESRIQEAPFRDFVPLVEELTASLQPLVDQPFGFFGHSMGALLGFEVARMLRRRRGPIPEILFLSAGRAPQFTSTEKIHGLPEGEFLQAVARYGGIPPALLGVPDLLAVFLPILRADFEILAHYIHQVEPPISSRVVAMGGVHDQEVNEAHLMGWREHTLGAFALEMYPGDHFFIQGFQQPVVGSIAKHVGAIMRDR